MKIKSLFFLGILIFAIALFIGYTQESKRIATIVNFSGTVEVKIGSGPWVKAETGMTLSQGDLIRTQKDSSCLLNFDESLQSAVVEVKESSQLRLAELLEDKVKKTQSTLLDLAMGEVLVKAKKLDSEKSKFEVKTPTSIVGVRGTSFSVNVSAQE